MVYSYFQTFSIPESLPTPELRRLHSEAVAQYSSTSLGGRHFSCESDLQGLQDDLTIFCIDDKKTVSKSTADNPGDAFLSPLPLSAR